MTLSFQDDLAACLPSGVQLELFNTLPSTNTHLLEQACPVEREYALCVALNQTQGRGQPGKIWQSIPGCSLTCSWAFRSATKAPLSLAFGMDWVKLLREAGCENLGLKWPNDLVVLQGEQRLKLGGILLEAHPDTNGWVLGLGLNIKDHIDFPKHSTHLHALGVRLPFETLIAKLTQTLLKALEKLNTEGFGCYLQDWASVDVLAGTQALRSADQTLLRLQGINAEGALEAANQHGRKVLIRSSSEITLDF